MWLVAGTAHATIILKCMRRSSRHWAITLFGFSRTKAGQSVVKWWVERRIASGLQPQSMTFRNVDGEDISA